MKKMTVIAMALGMLLSMASCGESNPADSSIAETPAAADTAADQAEESAAENAENDTQEETVSDAGETSYTADYSILHGMKMFYPADDYLNPSRKTADGKAILQIRHQKDFNSWAEYIRLDEETKENEFTRAYAYKTGTGFMDKEPLSAEETKQYFFDNLEGVIKIISEHCPTASIREVEVETSETVQVVGKDFLRETGILHCPQKGDIDTIIDVAYAAYYGTPGFTQDNSENAPVIWIAYSDKTDDETKASLAELVDRAANDAEMTE